MVKSTNNYEGNIVDIPKKNERCYTISFRRNKFVKILRRRHYKKLSAEKIEVESGSEVRKREQIAVKVEKGKKFIKWDVNNIREE